MRLYSIALMALFTAGLFPISSAFGKSQLVANPTAQLTGELQCYEKEVDYRTGKPFASEAEYLAEITADRLIL